MKIILTVLCLISILVIVVSSLNDKQRTEKLLDTYDQIDKSWSKSYIDLPIYVINLDRSTDRWTFIIRQAQQYNLIDKIKHISAIDGEKIQDGQIIDDGIIYKSKYNNLTDGETGCTFAHIKAIYNAWKDGHDQVLIVEDDNHFGLSTIWGKSLTDILSQINDWKILKLHHTKPYNSNNIVKENSPTYSTSAYVINREGMRDVLDSVIYNNTFCIGQDHHKSKGQADRFIYSLTDTYRFEKPLLVTWNVDENESTIHPSHTRGHIQNTLNILNFYFDK